MSLTHVSLLVSFFSFFFFSMCSFSFRFFRNSLNLSSSSYILRIQYEHVSLARSFNGTHYYTFAYLLLVRSSYFAISVFFFFLSFFLKKKKYSKSHIEEEMIQLKERKNKNAKKENMSVEIKTKMSDQEKERKKRHE